MTRASIIEHECAMISARQARLIVFIEGFVNFAHFLCDKARSGMDIYDMIEYERIRATSTENRRTE